MLEGEVDRQVRAEADARRDQKIIGVARADERHDFAEHIIFPDVVAADALAWRYLIVVPGLVAVAVYAVKLDVAGVNLIGQRIDHQKIFPLVVTPPRTRKDDNRRTCMAVKCP